MTDQEINIAIAEVVGARFFSEDGGAFWHFVTKDGREFGPPTEDLNAMHEAEEILAEKGVDAWWGYVGHINRNNPTPFGHETAVHATARQRAEAFLRTFGKWME